LLNKKTDKTTRLTYEEKLWRAGMLHICGVDEVGRGPLAGPVMACAVIFPQDYFLPEVTDSKLLSAKKRKYLCQILRQEALDWHTAIATVTEIDTLNIRIATHLAMRRAIEGLRIRPDYALIDGEDIDCGSCSSSGIIKGDRKSFTIAAASIIAKEIRDQLMRDLDAEYPVYKFEKNKGYGTMEHIRIIQEKGICRHHRISFLKKIIDL
jgi:ribonuclease HII